MPIESILKLDDKQLSVLAAWKESLPNPHDEQFFEEMDCVMSGHPYNLTYYDTGLGPVIIVWTNIRDQEYSVHLEYDDDGEIVGAV